MDVRRRRRRAGPLHRRLQLTTSEHPCGARGGGPAAPFDRDWRCGRVHSTAGGQDGIGLSISAARSDVLGPGLAAIATSNGGVRCVIRPRLGDFAVSEAELQPVLKSLRSDGFSIVAIHHHMTGEQPRVLFLHYWGRGKAVALAEAVRRALDLTAWERTP